MEKNSRLVEADTQLTVALGDEHFRILCADVSILAELARELGSAVVDGDAFLGYKIDLPSPKTKFFVLLGADGSVLARARRRDDVLNCLRGHLAGLHPATKPSGGVRFGLRTLVANERAILLDPELLRYQTFSERRLEADGYRIVDRFPIDVDMATLRLLPLRQPPGQARWRAHPKGHCSPFDVDATVGAIVCSTTPDNGAHTPAQICRTLASATRTTDREEALTAAESMSRRLTVLTANPNDRGSIHRALLALKWHRPTFG